MSKAPPKKLKQTADSSFFSSPKKETATDSEPGKSSEDRDNVQKKIDYSVKKEVEEGPSKHLQQETEEETHKLNYRFNTLHTFSVPCKKSQNVLEALNTSQKFRNEKDKKKNKQKEILIQRFKEGVPRAAVKADFPCCLIETNEILEIDFIQDQHSSTNQTTADPSLRKTSKPEMLVTFRVKKEGGQKVQHLLKSKALRNRVQYVCVYAFKGEKIKTALKRDGRFNSVIFRKHCALAEFSDSQHELSNPVTEDLDAKDFQVVVISDRLIQSDSQDSQSRTPVKTEPNVASDADEEETVGSSKNPISTEQEKRQDGNTKFTNPLTKRYAAKPMADSKEILGILRDQFPVLLKQLKQREKLKKTSEVQKFFRAEYGKSVENFLEVKKVKQLMKLSDSVCQIRQGGSALGTGFLLFDRYVLTNAHVIGSVDVNTTQFTAVFGYEDLDSVDSKHIPVEECTAYFHGMDDKGRHLDYALLELDDVENIVEYPKLLDFYSPNAPTNRGQICIVGHPGEGVKKMDPCFIIESLNRGEAAEKYASENQHLIHVMNEVPFKEKWDFSKFKNQITYDSCFFDGSSGSPVFDVDCNLIGIHTGGYVYKEECKTYKVMEYGFSMLPILDHIRAQARIKGLQSIIRAIDAYCNVSGTAGHQNHTDAEMESAEESDEH